MVEYAHQDGTKRSLRGSSSLPALSIQSIVSATICKHALSLREWWKSKVRDR